MNDNVLQISGILEHEDLSASEIARRTGISQPTVSRTLKKLPVIKLGKARASVFSLVNSTTPKTLYQVLPSSQIMELAQLYAKPHAKFLITQGEDFYCHDNLPFYLYDVLPSGFLGAIALKQIVAKDSSLTTKSDDWSDRQILHYLMHYGDDLLGNLVLGQKMAEKTAQKSDQTICRKDYPATSANLNSAPNMVGSCLAGEQPKFTAFNGESHLIVKYSPLISQDNEVAQRHRDLLVCEHLALKALQAIKVDAAKSHLHIDDRIYLEIIRFDRLGKHGRKGMVSLKSLDAEYIGHGGNWCQIANRLLEQSLIEANSFFQVETAFAFGSFVANTDMHNGNYSFFMDGLTLKESTPIYDMLPMAYMPVQGELRNPEMKAPRFIPVSKKAYTLALRGANLFWESVKQNKHISNQFKTLTQSFAQEVKAMFAHGQ